LPADGTYRLSVENVSRETGPGRVYRLEIEPTPTADFSLAVDTEKVEAIAGQPVRLKVKCTRTGYKGPIDLSLAGDGVGFDLKSATIPAGKVEVDVEITCPESAARGRPWSFSIVGRAKTGDAELVHEASTSAALKKLFPRMIYSPPMELDGRIGLLVRPAPKRSTTTSRPTTSPGK
jgi:hypothetical protein